MHPLNTLAIAWFSFATVAATSAAISRCAGPPSTQACTMLWHDGTWRCLIGAAAYEPPLPAHFALDLGEAVDVNTLTLPLLRRVPKLGPKRAGAIIAHREQHGPFCEIEDLLDVPGIGVKTIAALRPWLLVSDPPPETCATAEPAAPP